ncbi:MAG: hypothetical protein KAY24_14435 [Candidatus Eisenbacteria sp.]|nr:hypothetical protein [Candidatus Eisenbacteria bacterium]
MTVKILATLLVMTGASSGFPAPSGTELDLMGQGTGLGHARNGTDPLAVRIRSRVVDLVPIIVPGDLDVIALHPGEWLDVWMPRERIPEIEALGYKIEILPALPRSVPEYFHRYEELLSLLEAYCVSYPDITYLEDIGDGWGMIYNDPDYPSYDIWALKISDNADFDEAEPVILYTGVHHAREPATLEVCLGIADHLLTRYGTDPEVTSWVDEHETWIVPLVNPDGHWCCTDMEWMSWRKNVRDNDGNGYPSVPFGSENHWWYPDGVDLNRNYAWQWGGTGASHDPLEVTYCGPFAFSEPETQAMRELYYAELPVFTVDYHSYAEAVLWPYGYESCVNAPDDGTLEEIGTGIASLIPRWGGSGTYASMRSGAFYPAAGTSSDWEYGELNVFAYTIETCTCLYPGEEELNHAIQGNVAGALFLQERVDGPGLRGIIRVEGLPAQGTITIVGIDNPPMNMPRRSHSILGDYYRILSPGTYDIRYTVPGWEPILCEDVVVPETSYVTLDVDFGSSGIVRRGGTVVAGISVSPCPVLCGSAATFRWPAGLDRCLLQVIDTQGRVIADLSQETHGRGAVSWIPRRASGLQVNAGIYCARLRTDGLQATCRFVVLGR